MRCRPAGHFAKGVQRVSQPVRVCAGATRPALTTTSGGQSHFQPLPIFQPLHWLHWGSQGCACVCIVAVGCPDFTVPAKAKLKREGDRVTVTCDEDRSLSWQRRCVGTRWEGELGTCPGSYATGAVRPPPGPLPIGKHVVVLDSVSN